MINRINIEPLIKLRDYFKTLPENYVRLNMSWYASDVNGRSLNPSETPECGTNMCLLGHLPLVGYPGLEGEGWNQYCYRTLNIDHNTESILWNYLFSNIWPNNIQLAVQRLDDVINKRPSTIIEYDSLLHSPVVKYNELFHDLI